MSINDASKALKDLNLEISINNENEEIDKEKTIIKKQIPMQGISIKEGSNVYIEY